MEDEDVDLTYDLLNRLKYLQGFVHEVMRLHPPVGAVFRRAKKNISIGVSLVLFSKIKISVT